MGPASSAASANQPAPGLFLLAWGIFATVVGLGVVTDFRGFAGSFVRSSYASSARIRRVPPWKWMPQGSAEDGLAKRMKLVRLIAIPFAIAGPIVTVAGVVQVLRGHVAIPRGPVLPLPFAVAFIGFGLVAVFQYWRRGGYFRAAARQGGRMRAAAIVSSLGALSFGVFMSFGQSTLGIAGWLVSALSGIPLMFSRRSQSSLRRTPADQGPPTRP